MGEGTAVVSTRARTCARWGAVPALVILALAIWTGVQGLHARSSLNNATSHLTRARSEASKGHLGAAAEQAREAEAEARSAHGKLGGFEFDALRPVPWVGRQVKAAQALSAVATTLTQDGSGLLAVAATSPLAGDDTGSAGISNLKALSVQLKLITPRLTATATAVTSAQSLVARLQGESLAGPLARAVDKLAPTLASVGKQLAIAQGATELADRGARTGRPLRLLFLAQDTWELRPSGGFIGSYGILEIGNGKIHMAKYADAKAFPFPRTPVYPPEPLRSNEQHPWALTGAGWWPDFPTSARAAEKIFTLAGGQKVDGVLGSTQQFLEDLLRATGTSLKVRGFPDVVTPANVSQRILYNVELKRPHDKPRKKFLIELTQELFNKLGTVHGKQARAGLGAFNTAFNVRHLQIYLNDPRMQSVFNSAGWSGALIAPRHSDIFTLADADFGSDKATRWVRKHTTYTVSRAKNGRLVAQVDVSMTDFGPRSKINPDYDSYLRIYAPPGSVLVDASQHKLDVRTGTESGLVTYGAGQDVLPGNTKVRHFAYYLPSSVVRNGRYSLLVRPQAGTPNDKITVRILLGKKPFVRTFTSNQGDQTITTSATGGPTLQIAPDAPWNLVQATPITAKCQITAKQPPALPKNATIEQRRLSFIASQHAIQPQLDKLRSQGCEQILIHYTKH
ncbi:MAG: nucleoside-diphosphate-sugar epimerase [Marmoricola sp.]|nr:nucleoside-diphosphate-sugar epimerase [Marmoricola sp.]